MISFLIRIDKVGLVREIKWSNPAYIIPNITMSIGDVFSELDRLYLSKVFDASSNSTDYSTITLRLSNHPVDIILFTIPYDEDALVFGVEEKVLMSCKDRDFIKEIVFLFMETIAESLKEENVLNTETARLHFEKIQSFNNELINTKRELEKANSKLDILNSDLNNRLVKDSLTGLVSRYQYRSEIEEQISRHPGKLGIFLFIDIDDFKTINDTYGHLFGDKYLVEFANRLKSLPIKNTIKVRISGDEFGLFISGLDKVDSSIAENIWKIIRKHVLADELIIDGTKLEFSISAGMSVYGSDTLEIYDLIEYADFAMYNAKRAGKNQYCIFDIDKYEEKNKKRTF